MPCSISFRTYLSAAISLFSLPVTRIITIYSEAHVHHIGLFREKISLQPVECQCDRDPYSWRVAHVYYAFTDYSKLPTNPTADLCFLLDPLIATGGTACAALHMLLDWGVSSQCLVSYEGAYSHFVYVQSKTSSCWRSSYPQTVWKGFNLSSRISR